MGVRRRKRTPIYNYSTTPPSRGSLACDIKRATSWRVGIYPPRRCTHAACSFDVVPIMTTCNGDRATAIEFTQIALGMGDTGTGIGRERGLTGGC